MNKVLIYSSIVAIILSGCSESDESCNIDKEKNSIAISKSMVKNTIIIGKGEELFAKNSNNIKKIRANIKDFNNFDELKNVQVKVSFIHLNKEKFYKSFSNQNGDVEIDIDLNLLEDDDKIVITTYKNDYIPISKTFRVYELDDDILELNMQRIKENVVIIEIDKSLHQLGDSSYSTDNFNSQFISSSEGTSFTTSFEIPKIESNYHNANLIFYAKGSELNNTISLNNQSWNITPSKEDGSYTLYTIPLLQGDFKDGENILTIISDISDYNSSDYDNFEFTNLEIEFYNLEGL